MRKPAIRTLLMLTAVSSLGLLATGCPDSHSGTSAYCDDSGCFECDADKSCWPIPNPRCSSDESCEVGSVCTNIGCAKPCQSQLDCVGGDACVTGFCAVAGFSKVVKYVPPSTCQDDSGCSAEMFCDNGSCAPRCKSDDDCGPDSVCAPCGKCQPKGVPATCGATQVFCAEPGSCGAGKACVQGLCHLQCESAASCPVGQVCADGVCADDPAPAQPECQLDLHCNGGSCINGYCHAACTTTIQCGLGTLCQMGVCQPDYTPAL